MSIDNQITIANSIFQKLHAVDPCCVLAGGAPRDWYFMKEANDLDFYIYQSDNASWQKELQLKAAGFEIKCALGENSRNREDGMYHQNPYITKVLEISDYDIPVQIISLNKSTFGIVDTFPFSICQIWYTPERGIQRSKNFKITEKTKCIFSTNELYSDKHRYIQKIKERFAIDFEFVKTKEDAFDKFVLQGD